MVNSTSEANALGVIVGNYLLEGDVTNAFKKLQPTLSKRTSFRYLDRIGWIAYKHAGDEYNHLIDAFLEKIADDWSMGGWVIIGSLLNRMLEKDIDPAIQHAYRYIIKGDTWFATDILSERVPGPALVQDIDQALRLIEPWRSDKNHWIRRSVGVAIHLWTKRNQQNPKAAIRLLEFLEPMISERHNQAIKGIGWGIKTIGKYYPTELFGWLEHQLKFQKPLPPKLMINKAITYLPEQSKQIILAIG